MATYWENSCSFGLRYVSWYKYLIVSLFFSHLGFWSGNLFLIAPFPDLCLLVPFQIWLKFKLIQDVIVILVTSKNEEDPIEIEGAKVATIQNIDFSNTKRQLTPQSEVGSG